MAADGSVLLQTQPIFRHRSLGLTPFMRTALALGLIFAAMLLAAIASSRHLSEFGKAQTWPAWTRAAWLGDRHWTEPGRRLMMLSRILMATALILMFWW